MTGPSTWLDPAHEAWEELAVGQAVGALEPEDEEAFQLHQRGCARCERLVVEVEAATAELAYLPQPLTPPDRLHRKVTAIPGADSRPLVLPGAVRKSPRTVRLTRPSSWGRPWVAFVVGVVIVLGLGVWNLVLQSESGAKNHSIARLRAVVRCTADAGCQQIKLVGATSRSRGLVLVRDDRATIVLDGEAPNAPSTAFFLWQAPVDGTQTVPVGTFNVTTRDVFIYQFHKPMPLPLAQTKRFIVTLEVAKPAPTQPSVSPIVTGDVAPASLS